MDKATYHKAMAVLHMLIAKIHEAADIVEASRHEPKEKQNVHSDI